MKRFILIAAFAAFVMPQSAQADIVIAGLDTWDSATAPTVPVVETGFTATATASATNNGAPTSWTPGEGNSRGSSVDTTWGTFAGPAAASAVTTGASESFTLINARSTGEVTLTVTNNTGDDYDLNAFHFDAVAFRFRAADGYELNVLAGSDITVGNVADLPNDTITALGSGAALTASANDGHDDIDIDLTVLSDNTLAPGETAIFQLEFTDGEGTNNGGHHLFLDNVAVSGDIAAAIPEPSSLALLGLAGMCGLVRRRK
jgi:hypothetical protein